MAEKKKASEMTGIDLLNEELDRVRKARFEHNTDEICLLVQTREQIRPCGEAESLYKAPGGQHISGVDTAGSQGKAE